MTDKAVLNKLVLGTAQFDPAYGFDAEKFRLSFEDYSLNLIEQAWNLGIKKIDTAPAYGAAHQVLKKYMSAHSDHNFAVTSKLKNNDIAEISAIREFFAIKNFSDMTVMLHRETSLDDAEMLSAIRGVSDEFDNLRWGVSIYNLEFAEKALKIPDCDVIQIPLSIFNQDFLNTDFIERAQKKGVKVVARSIFALGHIFRPISFFEKYPSAVKDAVMALHEFSEKTDIKLSALACYFVVHIGKVDEIIVGINTPSQLLDLSQTKPLEEIDELFSYLAQQSKNWDSSLFRPELWGKGLI
ncbi:aldo/keto reductase [Alphaproteobacteria bacterium]|nr:aldo/keto reductase [Alphaproteobacteria bacterium]MDB2324456.1 aldo/keto reductase [Alphaproteobacteria bacterium]